MIAVDHSSFYRDTTSTAPENTSAAAKLGRIEEKLFNFEAQHSLMNRWLPGTIQYDSVKSRVQSRKKHIVLEKIKDLARERWYLLALKAKYAGKSVISSIDLISNSSVDGLSIAARLARRITNVSTQIKASLSQYNQCVIHQGERLTWEVATKLCEASCELLPSSSSSVPADIRRQAVDHLTLISRSSEEIERLKEEMNNCINY